MTISEIYDFLKQYVDKKISEANVKLEELFKKYKTKEVGSHIDEILHIRETYVGAYSKYPTTRYDGSKLQAGDYFFDLNSNSYKTYNGAIWMNVACDRYCDKNKGIIFVANHSQPDEQIVIQANSNAFSVDNYTLVDGATITIEDNAVYKIL